MTARRKDEHQESVDPWRGFRGQTWRERINVRDFIQANYTPYAGEADFLCGPTRRTQKLWHQIETLLAQERGRGVLDVSQTPSSITAHDAGYIDQRLEKIVGLQN